MQKNHPLAEATEKVRHIEKDTILPEIEEESGVAQAPKILEPLNLLKKTKEDDVEQLRLAADPHARVGHKSAEKLQTLIEKSKADGMQVKTVIGDTAYSKKDNISYTKKNEIELVAKLKPLITQGGRKKRMNFCLTKMLVCTYALLDTWPFVKLSKARRASLKTKLTSITLMWSNANVLRNVARLMAFFTFA